MGRPNVNVAIGAVVDKPQATYKNVILKAGISFKSQTREPNCIYVIKWDFDLKGQSVEIPENCVLKFEGGSICNGTIVGQNTSVDSEPIKIFSADIELDGTWNVTEAYPEWFGAKGDGVTDDHIAIQKTIQYFSTTVFGKKIYCVGQTIYFQHLLERTIIGQGNNRLNGPGTTIHSEFDGPVFEIFHGINIIFRNLLIKGIDGNWDDLIGTAFNLGDADNSGRVFAFEFKDVSIEHYRNGIEARYSWNFTLQNVKMQNCYCGFRVRSFTSSTIIDSAFYQCYIGVKYEYGGYSSILNTGFDGCEIGVISNSCQKLSLISCGWEWTSSGKAEHMVCLKTDGNSCVLIDFPSVSFAPGAYIGEGNNFIELTDAGHRDIPVIVTNPSWPRAGVTGEEPNKGLRYLDIVIPEGSEKGCVRIINPIGEYLIRKEVLDNPYLVIEGDVLDKNLLTFHTILDAVNIDNTGVIITPNYNGKYILSGWCSAPQRTIAIAEFDIVSGKKYKLSGAPKNTTSLNTAFLLIDYEGRTSSIYSYDGNTVEFTAEATTRATCFLLVKRVKDDQDNPIPFNNIVFSPMVKLSDYGTDKFEPYHYTQSEYYEKFNGVINSGTSRPVLPDSAKGYQFFDTLINMPIYKNRDRWENAHGYAATPISGTSRPTGLLDGGVLDATKDLGFPFYDEDLKKWIFAAHISTVDGLVLWKEADGAVAGVKRSGTFAERPTISSIYVGFAYFCTDKQTTEGGTDGIMIYHKGSNIWVDALGRIVE